MKTVTGNPIVISDAKAMPAKDLKVLFKPKQDFNGYGKPWAEGQGKNLLPYYIYPSKTTNGITATVDKYGVVTLNGTSTAQAQFYFNFNLPVGDYYFSGFNGYTGGKIDAYVWDNTNVRRMKQWDGTTNSVSDYGRSLDNQIHSEGESYAYDMRIRVAQSGVTLTNFKAYPMIRRRADSDGSYIPYSNICPITGNNAINVVVNSDTIPIALGRTAYGGTVDVTTGILTVTDALIESYNGESLPSTWISDRDEYSAGATPTIGAQVVYKLAIPLTYYLTPHEISLLEKNNTISASDGTITVTYDEIDTFLTCNTELIYLLACLAGDESFDSDFTPKSRVGDLLYSYLAGTTPTIYTDPVESRVEYLLKYWLGFESKSSYISLPPRSRVEAILSSKIEGTSYTGETLSDVEKLLIRITI